MCSHKKSSVSNTPPAKMTTFACDLVSNAKKHLQFLKDIHLCNTSNFVSSLNDVVVPNIQAPPSAKEIESLRRYQDLWLPFVANLMNDMVVVVPPSSSKTETPSPPLIPPPDIAWLWHCHRLAPQEYCKYCETTFHGKIIEANPPFAFEKYGDEVEKSNDSAIVTETKHLWNETYPNESFFLKEVPSDTTAGTSPNINGYDLLGSARRQTAFLWQVSGERYACDTFLKQGVKNYVKFLKLTSKANDLGIILVPTYQIDLMWHTHILSSIRDYNTDCVRIMKRHMYHDDSLTDRDEGGVLDVSFGATQKLWKRVYGADYVVHGGMYRGEPPSAYYTKTWSSSSNDIVVSLNQNIIGQGLIGKVGASSTSANVLSSPKPWVPLNGTASDGQPAFIRTEGQVQDLIKDLPYRDPYVLCRLNRNTGYYHIETKEAQKILFYRMSDRLYSLKSEIMVEMCTCGLSKKNKATPAKVEYNNLKSVFDIMQKQLFDATSGNIGSTIPPDTMFSCAGSACGGAVALKTHTEYASACGTVMTSYAGQKLGFSPI
jgi:Glycine-rich domain-containing protein-like